MTMHKVIVDPDGKDADSDGKWYGTLPVILTRVVEAPGEDAIGPNPRALYPSGTHYTESFIGFKSPWGSVAVNDVDGVALTEQPIEWWKAKGFTVTVDRAMDQLRKGEWG